MQVEWFLALLGTEICPIRLENPALFSVEQIGHQHLFQHLIMHGSVSDGNQRFNAPVEIAGHAIG